VVELSPGRCSRLDGGWPRLRSRRTRAVRREQIDGGWNTFPGVRVTVRASVPVERRGAGVAARESSFPRNGTGNATPSARHMQGGLDGDAETVLPGESPGNRPARGNRRLLPSSRFLNGLTRLSTAKFHISDRNILREWPLVNHLETVSIGALVSPNQLRSPPAVRSRLAKTCRCPHLQGRPLHDAIVR
jgi:hypothetical protein